MFISKILKHSIVRVVIVSLSSLSSLYGARLCHAAVINGSFETGDFSGYSTIGDTSIQKANFGTDLVEGDNHALLSTTSVDGALFNISGIDSVPISNLEPFLGLASGSLSSLGNGDAINASAIKQTFTAQAGETVSFRYNFLTDEDKASPNFNDFAFAVLEPSTTNQPSIIKLADTFSSFNPSSFFRQETGYKTFSTLIPTSGIFTLGLGVVNVSDNGNPSGLLVDEIRSTIAAPKPVPEPSYTLGLLAFISLSTVSRLLYKVMN